MRDPRLTKLVIAAHGSADPRWGDVVASIADRARAMRPELEVRVAYLDHGTPSLEDVVDSDSVVVPLLLTSGFHVRVDIPGRTRGAVIAASLGPDPLLAVALADRLREAGYDGVSAVVLAAAGSSDESARDDVRGMAALLAGRLGVEVSAAFLSAGEPRLADVHAEAVSSYLLGPGAFHDLAIGNGAGLVSGPIGNHPVVADLVLARYDTCPGVGD